MLIHTETTTNRWGWVVTTTLTEDEPGVYTSTIATFCPKASNPDGTFGRTDVKDGTVRLSPNGTIRWASNGALLMQDVIRDYGFANIPGFDAEAHQAAYDADAADFFARYREMRATHGYSAQERAEMRAAFGAGEIVVDVVTGQRIAL